MNNQVFPPIGTGDDPRLSVHTLGEFLFCNRAGLQSYENQGERDDEPFRAEIKLNFLPPYELKELRSHFFWSAKYVSWMAGVLLAVGLVTVVLITRVSAWFAVAGLLTFGIGGKLFLEHLSILWFLYRTYRRAQKAGQRSPKDNLESNERVNWWAMLNDGFGSVEPRDGYYDNKVRMHGKPWRVLQRGGLRIPVIHLRTEKESLYKSHYAKVAAYCHLLRLNEPGTLSPYGVILFGDTYEGVAVPNNPESREQFHRALRRARDVIKASAQNGVQIEELSAPPLSLCKLCPWGKPFAVRPGENDTLRFGQVVPLNGYESPKDKRFYHSHCGDRFEWLAPHEKVQEKGLTVL